MPQTFSKRYISSLFYSILNSFMSFITSIILVRALTPEMYGNYQFLFSIFVTVFTFANLNTQNGYFTFISQKKESFNFYKNYIVWEFIQLFVIITGIFLLYFFDYFDLFLGLDLKLVLLATLGLFCTKNIKEVITNTFESKRITDYYLKSTTVINLSHLLLILYFSHKNMLSIEMIFFFIITEFLIYFVISLIVFRKHYDLFIDTYKVYQLKLDLQRYFRYIKPLFFSLLMAFLYLFLERWLLQKYGGPKEQAYLGIAIQFSAIILIFTTSIQKIFWKEAAEHVAKKNLVILENMFSSTTKNIYIITTIVSLFFIFNAHEIITVLYGDKYRKAYIVFILINVYTIHQTLGQLYGTFLLASEETKFYSYISILFTTLSIPLIFIAVNNTYGFNLGAMGVASVMVFIQLLSVSTIGYYIKKKFGFNSVFLYQLKYIVIFGIFLFIISSTIKFFIHVIYLQLALQLVLITTLLLLIFKEKIITYLNKGKSLV